jgi:hypothetical protein
MTEAPELNFEVQHGLVSMEVLVRCFAGMSFSGSVVEVGGDPVALALGDAGLTAWGR